MTGTGAGAYVEDNDDDVPTRGRRPKTWDTASPTPKITINRHMANTDISTAELSRHYAATKYIAASRVWSFQAPPDASNVNAPRAQCSTSGCSGVLFSQWVDSWRVLQHIAVP